MANYVEPYNAPDENIGKNFILNKISKDSTNTDSATFYMEFFGKMSADDFLSSVSDTQTLVFDPASDGKRSSPDILTFNFVSGASFDELYIVLFVVDPLGGDDISPLLMKLIDSSVYVDGGTTDVENISFDLNDGTPQISVSIPENYTP